MTRPIGVRIRTAVAAAVLLLAGAGCASDGRGAEPTWQPIPGAESRGTYLESLSDEDLAAYLEAQDAVEQALDVESDDEVVESPATTTMSPLSESGAEPGIVPGGFSTVTVEIIEADGTVCEVCVWLADSADERAQGLMGVTSLGTPEGMAFAWEQPTSGAFYMFQTVTPLSIAWFDAAGALVSTADMEPCRSTDPAECERFPAGGDYVLALEVFEGDLASIGITDGATARLLPATESTDCPLG